MTPVTTNATPGTTRTVTTLVHRDHLTFTLSSVADRREEAFWQVRVEEALGEPNEGARFQGADEFLSWLNEQ